MKKEYLSSDIRKEITYKLLESKGLNPYSVSSICQRIKRKRIKTSAQMQSFRIENPDLAIPFSVPRNKNKARIKEGINNIKEGFEWGRKNFNPKNFDESFFREIAGRITPEIYDGQIATYRSTGTGIKGATVTPPYPQKLITTEIPWFVKSLKQQLEDSKLINKVESAIYAHLHFVRMHPFIDGNGRTSRILQDIILDYNQIPVPIIKSGERMVYYNILDRAIYDWKHNGGKEEGILTDGEKMFYNFMAGKINISLDCLLDSCNHS